MSPAELPEIGPLLEALGAPVDACVGAEVSDSSGVVERTAWWRNLDPSGRPVVGASLLENERGRFDDFSTWTRRGGKERQVDREGPDIVRETTTTTRQGLPVKVVLDRDEGWGPSRLVTTLRYDRDGHEVLRVDDYREGPMRKRTLTVTERDPDGRVVRRGVSSEEAGETVPGCVTSVARDGLVETWTTDCDDGGIPATLAWTRDPAGRVLALHREAPFIGVVDVEYVREMDGTLLGSVEVGETHRIERAFTGGCGREPDPEAGDVR